MRRATQADVARAAGVSRALVSIAFRGVPGVSPENRDLIFRTAERLQYRPNKVAAQLASRSARPVGVYLLNMHNELFAEIYDGICDVLGPSGDRLVLSIGSKGFNDESSSLETLIEAQVGVVIAVGALSANAELLRIGRNVPIVSASRHVPGLDSVFADDVLGGRKATEHLLGLGHRRILHLASPAREGYAGRREGYQQAMATHALPSWIVETDYSRESAAAAIASVLDRSDRPTAIFANNDQTALGVLEAMYARGLRCPEDISLVGYDNTPSATLPGISLTSMDIKGRELGRRSARAAERRLEHLEAEAIESGIFPELIARGSSGPFR